MQGTLAFAADAIEDDDSARLYRVIDERARHAMISIVADRRAAAEKVRSAYPAGAREEALRHLGDAATVQDGSELFALRCGEACRRDLASRIGGIERVGDATAAGDGEEVVVHTTRDATVDLYRRGEGHWWGIVWQTEPLDRERARANQDLQRIEENAQTYRRRRRLEGGGGEPESEAPADSANEESVDPSEPNG